MLRALHGQREQNDQRGFRGHARECSSPTVPSSSTSRTLTESVGST